ncbi:transglutaminase TgpA family protein [Microbacterium gilvum]|uniref:DUF3488 and transglutaminase-like domain-containing protein n=1 Tax=Microbacterium gilvum TaxID=1336204 RepID=A0ABP9AQZ1_9MICO
MRRPRPRRRRADAALAVWTGIAVIAAVLPLARIVTPSWLPGTVLVVAIVLAAGFAVRRTRRPGWAVVAEIAAWVVCATVALPASVPRAVVVPVPETFPAFDRLLIRVAEEILQGVAPLDASSGLSWVLLAAIGLFAIAMAHVVLTARLPLLAAVGFITVSLIPSFVVPQRVEPVYFVPLAVAVLLLLRADTRARDPRRGVGHAVSASAVAAVVGTVAVVAALAIPPFLPQPVARPGSGLGPTTTIDADLDLGASLREPSQTEVLQLTTAVGSAPYLRVATLSSFDGDVWTPDTGALTGAGAALPGVPGIEVATVPGTARIEITRLAGEFLPVPYALTGLDADGAWSMLEANRTIASSSETSLGAEYGVQWQRATPTREQAQAAAVGADAPAQALALPALPDIVTSLAQEVTAEASSPYDRLRALQTWFRGGAFAYSLDAPVEEGFDGSGVEAIARFLEVRSGYCVHFASAFAVMARSLGIPTRVVVGYLPGTSTGTADDEDGAFVYSYTSAQLHAWPEAYLDGIGWTPFEPTASLGVPTNFLPETPGEAGSEEEAPLLPSSAPTPTATADDAGRAPEDVGGGVAQGDDDGLARALAATGAAVLALLALLLPFLVRTARRMRRFGAGDDARPRAVWREVVDLAIDAGVPVAASDSPRALGARLVAEHGAPSADVDRLVGAVERSAYGREGGALTQEAAAASVERIRLALLPTRGSRARAALLPRSLAVRPTVVDPV